MCTPRLGLGRVGKACAVNNTPGFCEGSISGESRLYFYLSPRPTSAVSCLCKPGSDKCTILNLRFPSDKIDIILGVLGSFEDVGRSLTYGLG